MNNKESKPAQRKRERSTAYPAYSLEVSANDIKVLKERLGRGPYSREEAAKALGYSGINGISAGRIAACVHYGLLSRSGSTYSVSDLAEKIISPLSDHEKAATIAEAFQNPLLYNKLFQEYAGQALPTMLPNILTRSYGIAEKAAKNAARIFRESAEFAQVLKNGVITTRLDNAAAGNDSQGDKQNDDRENISTAEATINNSPSEALVESQTKERGISESGDGWQLNISLTYSQILPRDVRKKITELLDVADDLIDQLSALPAGNAKSRTTNE